MKLLAGAKFGNLLTYFKLGLLLASQHSVDAKWQTHTRVSVKKDEQQISYVSFGTRISTIGYDCFK